MWIWRIDAVFQIVHLGESLRDIITLILRSDIILHNRYFHFQREIVGSKHIWLISNCHRQCILIDVKAEYELDDKIH